MDMLPADDQLLRQTHIGRLLQQAERAYRHEAVQQLQQQGHQHVTLAHVALLSYLDLEGTRLTTLAERAGITKQSMRQLALELETLGYIIRQDDPTDRRASLCQFTEMGQQFLREATNVKQAIEAQYRRRLGAQEFAQLRSSLLTLLVPDATSCVSANS